jgi:hypothetical protein
MRRKHKLHYYVQDWSGKSHFYWNRGDWHQPLEGYERIKFLIAGEVKGVGVGGASSTKHCRNLKAAMRCARRLKAKGGVPLISRSYIHQGKRYWIDYYLK